MIKWFDAEVLIPQMPDGYTARMIGLYESENTSTHITRIILSIKDSENITRKYILYSHRVKSLPMAEPSPEDLLSRYQPMINKFMNLYMDIKYSLINFKKYDLLETEMAL